MFWYIVYSQIHLIQIYLKRRSLNKKGPFTNCVGSVYVAMIYNEVESYSYDGNIGWGVDVVNVVVYPH